MARELKASMNRPASSAAHRNTRAGADDRISSKQA
jgi:hypothetical protein